jgi:uncharacterized protein YndB with AHSA1/START domain
MQTRKHTHLIELPVGPNRVFELLITPSAIREWWGADRAIVIAAEGGTWTAAWGREEDNPEYVTASAIKVFDPPRRLLLNDSRYYARSGQPPFESEMTTEFVIEESPNGATLRVIQDGFPVDTVADEFYAACEIGWKNTFSNIKQYLTK